MRDPRKDPRPGDAFAKGSEYRILFEIDGDEAIFGTNRGEKHQFVPINEWCEWCQNGVLIHAAK